MLELITQHSGAVACAAVSIAALDLPAEQQQYLDNKCPDAQTAYIAAFPYYYGGIRHEQFGMWSRGENYVPALRTRMERAAEALSELHPDHNFTALANGYPLPIVKAARLSGLCITGRNALAILPPYGSYIFLSAIVTTMSLDMPPQSAGFCNGCNLENCGCPTKALTFDAQRGTKLERERCLSSISQDPDATEEQLQLLKHCPTIWGCDLCQLSCPYNKNPQESPYPEFRPADVPNVRKPELLERNVKYTCRGD